MKKLHFIAIGGSAMHSLAIALKNNGDEITGSDDAIFDPSKSNLEAAGICPKELGWFPEKITPDLAAVILGMHAKADNPELIKAKEMGVLIYSYPEFIYAFSKEKTRVVIAGSHGKTTITAMILHVLNYQDIAVDYMIGASLSGFENSVYLSETNDFILLEGDEYLSSPIDLRPKFHLYKPQIALISGIAWDHVNVFPTQEDYNKQFEIFIDSITPGGVLVYNDEDATLASLSTASPNTIRKEAYQTPDFVIEKGTTYLETDEGPLPLEIFGNHNLSNLAGAKWICQLMGVDEDDFYQAITSFMGASKRLEKMVSGKTSHLYKDFAHAPSKVSATTNAVKNQFSEFKLIACFELHTFSSLDKTFINKYQDSLSASDQAIVFYDPAALKIKNRPEISEQQIKHAFDDEQLLVFTDPLELEQYLNGLAYTECVLLMMSSGNYGGIDWGKLKNTLSNY